ncbi:TPA: hypothetical protein ACX6PO_003830 [Photobacterium damselae]
MKKTVVFSAVLLSIGTLTSFVAAAADTAPTPVAGDFSSADIQWVGHAKIIPGENITITGADGASEAEDGVLKVMGDGTFSTTTPVKLESRLYWNTDASADGSKEAGDLFATDWTLSKIKPLNVNWGMNVTDGMTVKITDRATGIELTDAAGPKAASQVMLDVENVTPPSVVPVDPRAELSVQATVLATVAA